MFFAKEQDWYQIILVVFVVLIRVQYWFRIKQEEWSRKCLKGLDLKNFEIEM